MMLTTQAMAKIHPTAFKGVSEHFMVKVSKKETKGKKGNNNLKQTNNKENLSNNTEANILEITSDTSSNDDVNDLDTFTTIDNTMYSPTFGMVALE